MIHRFRSSVVPLFALLIVGCASAGSGAGGDSPVGDPDLITREEIDRTTGSQNAYDLIQALRPQWLITRGLATQRQATGEDDIVVYLDNARLGYRGELRRVTLASVRYLEFYDARRATLRWGGGHLHGAIYISTRDR